MDVPFMLLMLLCAGLVTGFLGACQALGEQRHD
ncbi:hypothetical protein EV669_102340 [Gulbenkiania mobilis]|uniref:Uncharacterized protein n=1 Tax=Gulbenkiania mobilis TaxID=397457 RepID=A0ABY2D2M5_GULMO|nr:hypothetical protein EV669_102340 [Gulbenkiania mobilis]